MVESAQHIGIYLEHHIAAVSAKIQTSISEEELEHLVQVSLGFHLTDPKSSAFQSYYFQVLENRDFYFEQPDFFKQFKKQYSLQGIDNEYLRHLEVNKKPIMDLVDQGKLARLYGQYFRSARIKHGQTWRHKELGSFFAKFVHMYRPQEFCALDNPIKNYLGLAKESFFVSHYVISAAYKMCAEQKGLLLGSIRREFAAIDHRRVFDHQRISDLKLLDLMLWSQANRDD